MKKLCKILFLTLIVALTVCVRSYATDTDTTVEGGSSTDIPTVSESTEDNTDQDSDDVTDPSTDPDGSDVTDPTTDPDGDDVKDPTTDPDGGDVTDPSTDPDGGDIKDPTTDPDGGDVKDPNTDPDNSKDDDPTGMYSAQDEKSNIKISAPAGVVPNGTTLKVEVIINGDTFDAIVKTLGDVKFTIFDISLLNNNSAVQPTNGTVKISIPIPAGYDKTNLIAYRFAADGTKEKEYTVTVEGDYAVIEVDHFSDYVLAEKTSTTDVKKDSTLDKEPKTGINNPVTFVVSILIVACLGLAICIKKISK